MIEMRRIKNVVIFPITLRKTIAGFLLTALFLKKTLKNNCNKRLSEVC